MELKEIVTISGKSGLFKIVKPTRMGFVLEALDDTKKKIITNPRQKVSILEEISVYTTDGEGSIPLKEVMDKVFEQFQTDPGVDGGSSSEDMRAFMEKVIPNYDEERVYISDIKKLISWYRLLVVQFPEMFKTNEKPPKKSAAKPKKAGSKKASESKKD